MSANNYYKITIVQKQPLHLGVGNFGVVAESRNFVLPHQFVSAVLNANNIKNSDYNIEQNFDKIIKNISIFKPQYLNFDKEKEFNRKYKQTFVSTAVIPGTRGAKDQSLHEIEYISYLDRRDNYMKWEGYINSNFKIDGINFEDLKGKEIYLGGEFKYGFGFCKISEIENGDDKEKYFLENVDDNSELKNIFPLTLRLTTEQNTKGHNFVYKGFYGFKLICGTNVVLKL